MSEVLDPLDQLELPDQLVTPDQQDHLGNRVQQDNVESRAHRVTVE